MNQIGDQVNDLLERVNRKVLLTSGTLESPINRTNDQNGYGPELRPDRDKTNAILTSGTLDSQISKHNRQPIRSKSHSHPTLVRKDSYIQRLTERPRQQSTQLISYVVDQQKVLIKSKSWDQINAIREEPINKKPKVMKIICDICNKEFLDNKDPILYCFTNYCDLCKKMHDDLFMKKVDRNEIYSTYEMEITYLAAKHAHNGECNAPEDCKITFHKETKLLPLLRYFKKRDRDMKDSGKVKDLYDDRMKYYRRPIEYSCKCDHCVTFYIIVSARIVKS